jgi:hypothetical protein
MTTVEWHRQQPELFWQLARLTALLQEVERLRALANDHWREAGRVEQHLEEQALLGPPARPRSAGNVSVL